MRHNPPWKAEQINGIWAVTTDREDHTDEYDVNEDPDEQTVRLEAAAPELLAACEMCQAWFDRENDFADDQFREELRSAIAKATAVVAPKQSNEKVGPAIEGRLKALELQVDLLLGVVEQLAAACEEAASFYATMMGEDSLAEDMPLLTAAVRMIRATGPRESSHSTPQGDIEGAAV